MPKNYIQAIQASVLDTTDLDPAYAAINPDGLPQACSILRFVNASDNLVAISYDGVTNHDAVLANESLTLNAQTNAQPNANVALFKKGLIVYVSSPTATAGQLALIGYYQGE